MALQLNLETETGKSTWTFAKRLIFHHDSAAVTRHILSRISGPKIHYWSGTPILSLWFGSEWLLAVSRNKVCLKRTKTSGLGHQKNVTTAMKSLPKEEIQKCFQQWQHRWATCIAVQRELHSHTSYRGIQRDILVHG